MLKTEHKPLSVIEALAGGFELILLHPWALLVPVALDLFVWLGPQISAKPLFETMIAFLNANASLLPDNSADTMQSVEMIRTTLQSLGDTFNLLGVVSSGVPTLFWVDPPKTDWAHTILFVVDNVFAVFVSLIPLGLAGIVFAVTYFEIIAHALRKETNVMGFPLRVAKGFLTTVTLGLFLLIGLFGLMVPISLGAALLSFVSQGLASFILFAGMLLMLWVGLYLSFALPAIFITGSSAPQAILNSVSLFRFDFWSTMGLVVLTYLIRWGFTIIWQLFLDTPSGIVFDVIGNAFLGTGLLAALMVYYSDRMKWLNDLRRRIHQHQAQLKG